MNGHRTDRTMVGRGSTILVACGLAAIGTFSPWLSAGRDSILGVQGDGMIVLLLLVCPLVAGIIGLTSRRISRGLGAAAFISAGIGVAITINILAKIVGEVGRQDALGILGFGFWLTLIFASVAAVASLGAAVTPVDDSVSANRQDPVPDGLVARLTELREQKRKSEIPDAEFYRLVLVEGVMGSGTTATAIQKLKGLHEQRLIADDELRQRLDRLLDESLPRVDESLPPRPASGTWP